MIIGIDLGTTNSAAAVWKDGAATLIPNRLGQTLTPSAVSIDDDGTLLVGLAARERQASHPHRLSCLPRRGEWFCLRRHPFGPRFHLRSHLRTPNCCSIHPWQWWIRLRLELAGLQRESTQPTLPANMSRPHRGKT